MCLQMERPEWITELGEEMASLLAALDIESSGDYTLASGLSGCGLGLWALQQYLPSLMISPTLKRIDNRLQSLLADEGDLNAGLFQGLAGVGYAYTRYCDVFKGSSAEYCADIDEILQEYSEAIGQTEHFDLVSGVVGVALYALDYQGSQTRQSVFLNCLKWLETRAELDEDGASWRTLPKHYGFEASNTKFPSGTRNLGIAHGIPGAVAFLALAVKANGADARMAQRLLELSCDWLVNVERKQVIGGIPYLAEEPNALARLAWCYGDAGVALTIVSAGRVLHRADLIAIGTSIGRRAVRRAMSMNSVGDVTLCHGVAGWMLVFERLRRNTGDDEFLLGTQWCQQQLFDAYKRDGLHSLLPPSGERGAPHHLLSGSLGVVLALLDVTAHKSVDWASWLGI